MGGTCLGEDVQAGTCPGGDVWGEDVLKPFVIYKYVRPNVAKSSQIQTLLISQLKFVCQLDTLSIWDAQLLNSGRILYEQLQLHLMVFIGCQNCI